VPRIYLCDDAREYRTLLKAVLDAEAGFEVVGEGGDSGACIADVTRHDPDVILLDVNMPGRDGIEALPDIRDVAPEAHVLVLSTARAEECEERALGAGAAGFIQKPSNIFDLPAMIRRKLEDAGIEP
jgi:DNA-binding NarL/FixJ family response regulator